MLEVVEEGILRFLVASEEQGNADEERLLQDVIVIDVLQVLAEEFDASDVDKRVLPCCNNLAIRFPILARPVGRRRHELLVFYFDDLA